MKWISLTHFKIKYFIYIAIFFSVFYRTFCDFLGAPSAIRYIIDICILIALVEDIAKPHGGMNKYKTTIRNYTLLFLLISVLTYLLVYQSVVYCIYGIVFRFRYYFFSYLLIRYFTREDIDFFVNFFEKLFYVNVVAIAVEYIAFGLYGDYLGGIFGITQGCNGYLNIFLVVSVTISIIKFLNKQEKLKYLIIKIVLTFGIASIAELKFFFAEFIVLLLFTIFFTGFSWKKLGISIISIAGFVVGYIVFSRMYSYADSFLNIDSWIKVSTSGGYAAGYSGFGEFNRLTFLQVANARFLKSTFSKMIGLGIGNCGFSSIELFNTPFYKTYSGLRYQWFTSAHLYLEQGWLGIIGFIGYFALVFICSNRKDSKSFEYRTYNYLSKALSILGVLFFLYNNSLTTEAGFMFYLFLMANFVITGNS